MTNPRIAYEFSDDAGSLVPPDGKPLIVHLVINVEHWRFDQPMPRKIVSAPHDAESVPDIPNYSWAEYGMWAIEGSFAWLGLRDDPARHADRNLRQYRARCLQHG